MKLNRAKLLKALIAVAPGIAQKEVIEQSTSYIFTEDGNIATFNDEIAVSCPCEVSFVGAVPAKEFLGLVNKLTTEEIEITEVKNTIVVKGSRAKAGLRLESEIKLPIDEMELPEEDDYTDLPKQFCDAVQFCLFSASKDQTKPILTCLHIHKTFVESNDNYRITRYNMGKDAKKSFPESILIPAFSAKQIITYKPTAYALTEGWVHFTNNEEVVFSCRIFEDEYPDITDFLDVEGDSVELPKTLGDILDRASIMSEDNQVTISLEEGKLTVSTENGAGWFEESARVVYDGDSVEFNTSPEFLRDIMKKDGEIVINPDMLKFEGKSFEHVFRLLPVTKKG